MGWGGGWGDWGGIHDVAHGQKETGATLWLFVWFYLYYKFDVNLTAALIKEYVLKEKG